ncbi:MAG: RibD family protein [Rhodospirillales bacterium]|nr:RibD family protein [Rhodospirillales bacterium]
MIDLRLRRELMHTDGAAWRRILGALEKGLPLPDSPPTCLEQVFAPLLASTAATPYVIGQAGQSLDGRIATLSGHSHYVNGPSARRHLHRLRAWADAVVVGIGTILHDDPELTVRHVQGPSPARVVIDPGGRLPPGARVLRDDGVRRIVLRAAEKGARGCTDYGAETVAVPTDPCGLIVTSVVEALGRQGFRRILVEGGANTLSRFLAAGAIHRLHILVAPLLIGSGLPVVALPAVQSLNEAMRPEMRTYAFDDGDVLFDCDFTHIKTSLANRRADL